MKKMCEYRHHTNNRAIVYDKDKSFRTLIFHRSQDQQVLMQKKEQLVKTLQMYKVFETDEDRTKRKLILHTLNRWANLWVRNLVKEKELSEYDAERTKIKVLTFGSYKLGVHDSCADLDTVFVGTKYINRSDFFMSFYKLLTYQTVISELRAIEDAYVPLIKMKMFDIQIDMLFVRLWVDDIPEQPDLRDSMWLENLNELCVRSLNGYRATLQLLYLVPNLQKFRLTLRTIRLWAKCKGIYSNILGFLGGVSWALLVAKICITYPNVDVVTTIGKFFEVYSKWNWPEPVTIQEPENINLGYTVFDKKSRDLMPIIIPIYPERNTSFNVLPSSFEIIQEEIRKARDTYEKINMGIANWGNLFEKPCFFGKYEYYIVLNASSEYLSSQTIWQGFVETKLRQLIALLDHHPSIARTHVNTDAFRPMQHHKPCCYMRFLGLRLKEGKVVDETIMACLHLFLQTVKMQAEWTFKLTDDMDLEATLIKRKDLQNYIPFEIFKHHQAIRKDNNPKYLL